MKKISYILLLFFMMVSCSQELVEPTDTSTSERVSVPVSFTTSPLASASTRAIDPSSFNDTIMANLWVIQFDQTGAMMQNKYYSTVDVSNFKADLAPNAVGEKSNIYFVANIGATFSALTKEGGALVNETEFLNISRPITSEEDLFVDGAESKKNIFLAGSLKEFSVVLSGYMPRQTVKLDRMLSKVEINYGVGAEVANFITIETARLCNVPKTMAYFPPQADVAPTNTSETFNYPLQEVTAGGSGTLTYYIPDNQRGDVTNISEQPHLKGGVDGATYLELSGHTIGSQGGDAITYRVYLGKDNFKSYNVERNRIFKVDAVINGISGSDLRVHRSQPANCYIVPPGGLTYISIKQVNASHIGVQLPDLFSGWTPFVYWQSEADLVTVTPPSAGQIYFKVTAKAGAEGNAVVAIKDASGNILWSWHIWVTDYDPNTQNIEANGYIFMGRNLGAKKEAGASASLTECTGLYYQWGRKDPFPSTSTTSVPLIGFTMPPYTGLTTAAVTNDAQIKTTSIAINNYDQLMNSVRYPLLYVTNWNGSSSSKDSFGDGGGATSWNGLYGQPKSLYDPCPEGWRVPSGYAKSTTYASPWNHIGSIVLENFTGYSSYATYPVAGCRKNTADIYSNSAKGYYWIANGSTANSTKSLHFAIWSTPETSIEESRAYGFNVRCVKDWIFPQ